MRRFFISCLLLLAPSLSHAAGSHQFGLGVILGSPTGISGKAYLSKVNAVDAALAWSLGDHKVLHVHGDYLWVKPAALQVDKVPLTFFYGIGARLISWSDYHHPRHDHRHSGTAIGPRVPVGLSYTFRDPVIEIFGEAALVLDLIPDTDIDVDAGVGVRFYF